MNVLVLGGSGGIGTAVCKKLADQGHLPIAVDKSPSPFNWIDVDFLVLDRADAVAAEAERAHGHIDAIVNCAGLYDSATLEEFTWSDFADSFRVNVEAPVRIILQWARDSAGSGATRRVVNVTSAAATLGSRDLGYSMSKGAIDGASKSLARSLARIGILVFGIAPGIVASQMSSAMPVERRNAHIAESLLKRPCSPEEVAALACLIVSGECDYLVGSSVNLSGGAVWN